MTKIEWWRNKNAVSQATLAERARVSQGAVARAEGGNTPSLLTACMLAEVTGVRPEAMLADTEREALESLRRDRKEGGK